MIHWQGEPKQLLYLSLEEVEILYKHFDKKAQPYVDIYHEDLSESVLEKADAAIDIAGNWEIALEEFKDEIEKAW